ncbi:glycosyltransferase family 39 protein [Mangrovihabitans endophyticus]|uniref:Glycosyltransferase RgtA/B/C/D-like domain-containing protein n=1 Tax=Mangrovihabitans endophyticus TaxID=1751298 RepID=A0A8J3FM95_9ACTN|nr:glycosyltransferase family 39 protein [Mangrovihabitans endophyticus]GGK77781.1 hypothetical protein GCM10012284_09650 [Mangrovihabitans endophyticus]
MAQSSRTVRGGELATSDDAPTRVIPRPRRRIPVTARPTAVPSPRADVLFWMLPALVAAALGGWRLTAAALWADELATWGAVRLSWEQLWRLSAAVDAVLTPYYAMMKLYTAVAGTSTAALRLPALAATVATSLVVTALGRRLGGRDTGLAAGLLFAVVPVTSRYAQEARPYALAMFAAALAVLCLIRLLDDPGPGRAAAYSSALALAALSHPLSALLLLAGHALAVALRQVRVGAAAWYGTAAWIIAAVPGGAAALILVGLGYRSRGQIGWIEHLTLSGFDAVPDGLFLTGAVGGIVIGLAVLAVRRTDEHVCVAAAAFTPLLVLLAADQVMPIWVTRYVLVAVPALAALAAAAMLRFGRTQAVVALALTVALGVSTHLRIREPDGHGEDSARIASVIGPRWRPGDVVVFADSHRSIPWAARDIYQRYLPAPRPPDVLRVSAQRTDGRFLATECPAASCLGNPPRVWVIRVDKPSDPFQDMAAGKRQLLREHYQTAQRWTYALLTIILVERKPSAAG